MQTDRSPSACLIKGEISSNGEKPRFKTGATVEGGTALKHTEPGFLHQILDAVLLCKEIDQVPNETPFKAFGKNLQHRRVTPA